MHYFNNNNNLAQNILFYLNPICRANATIFIATHELMFCFLAIEVKSRPRRKKPFYTLLLCHSWDILQLLFPQCYNNHSVPTAILMQSTGRSLRCTHHRPQRSGHHRTGQRHPIRYQASIHLHIHLHLWPQTQYLAGHLGQHC